MKKSGTPTQYPGVFRIENKVFRVRGKVTDQRTGRKKEVDRILRNVTARQAAVARTELIENERAKQPKTRRTKVGEFAQSWMKSKTLKLSASAAITYADALDDHILPAFGDWFYDAVTTLDVQEWVDDWLLDGWTTRKGTWKPYSHYTVHSWYRVFRTMTGDAVATLHLPRDPTLRIQFPEAPEPTESKALNTDELVRFLREMCSRYPQHGALTIVLAYTGLRFCHASALWWDDWDEERALILVRRKQVRGQVGPVSRKKRAPREYPIEPELAKVLRQHRKQLFKAQAPGVESGWMFPSSVGTARSPSSLYKAWAACSKAAGIDRRFTVHGLRYTFNDLSRHAKLDAVVRRALTGHVTEEMQWHYSNVSLDEKRAAIAEIIRIAPLEFDEKGGD